MIVAQRLYYLYDATAARLLAMAVACYLATQVFAGGTRQCEQPNVILILADDLAIGDLAFHNGGLSRTPNLDRLASESIQFEAAYSASCVCAPARASLLTGRYPHRTGVVSLNMERYPALTSMHRDETTIADVFRSDGYATGLVGKWHCGAGTEHHPTKRGFEEFEGFIGAEGVTYFKYALDIQGEIKEEMNGYLTEDLTRRAMAFIRRHRHHPFFLHLAHYAPHRPLEAPSELVDFYQSRGLDESTATIYAMIEVMDRGIGELLDELERLEIADQTIVVFASDNGPDPLTGTRFNESLNGTKYEIFEGGIRVPLFIRWPNHLPAGIRSQRVHFIDIFPTLVDLCGTEYEAHLKLDGISLREVLFEDSELPARNLFWQWNRGEPNYTHNAAVRSGPWKLVRPYVTRKANPPDSNKQPLLFNLSDDPREAKAQTRIRAHDEPFSSMLQALEHWSEDVENSRTRNRRDE